MSATPEQYELEQLLVGLESGKGAIPWMQRRAEAATLGKAMLKPAQQGVAVRLIYLLADDPKWEVRKEIASLLPSLPDDEFALLAAKLTQDSNGFVRKAAERAMDLRRKGTREVGNRRKGLDQVVAQFDLMVVTQGKAVSDNVLALAMRLYEVSVAATVHDLRGVLTSACSQVDRLRAEAARSTPKGSAIQDGLSRIADRLAYLEKFVDAMGTYSQAIPPERVAARLDRVVQEAHGVAVDAAQSAKLEVENVEASIRVDDGITVVVAQHQVVTALANVIKNAYEAILLGREGGRTGRVTLTAENGVDGEVRIVVQDNGMGINAKDLRELRAFVPGRTTKKGYGTGFGLPVAQRYIAAHGGSIAVDSSEDSGTRVTIILPAELQQGPDA